MDYAKEFSKNFKEMPDRFKDLYLQAIYKLARNNNSDVRILVDIYGLPEYCESPIEQILWLALNVTNILTDKDYVFLEQQEVDANGNKYRVDFLFVEDFMEDIDNPFYLVIECDGHEFHEKTKEQVERRNKRDMDLKMEGYDILHFSGSQIFNKPYDCALEVFKYIDKRIEDKNGGKENVCESDSTE